MADVAIIAGSDSDLPVAEKAFLVLEDHGISYDFVVLSAHRDPDRLDDYVRNADCSLFITIAGLSAALPGVVAARTDKPVIGVPVAGTLMGIDALLSIAQMPAGVPVACVGIGNGANAAYLAVRILTLARKKE